MAIRANLTSSIGDKGELVIKIKELRLQLRVLQDGLAERLDVGRTQVVAWENKKKTDQPSVANLLKMAEKAETFELRKWFLTRAGVNLDQLEADLAREKKRLLEPVRQGMAAVLPVIRTFRSDSLTPKMSDSGEYRVPAEWIANRERTVATLVRRASSRLWGLPAPLRVGDLAVLDRTLISPEDFIRRASSI